MFIRLISLLWGFPPQKVELLFSSFFPHLLLEGISPPRVLRFTQASGGVSDHHFSNQFPDPPPEPMPPFKSRVDTWIYGLVSMGYHSDIAEFSTKKDKPSTHRQFQSGWKQAEAYIARHSCRFEDVTAVAFTKFLGRQFIDLGLAASTIIIHCYACVKPAWVNLILLFR